MKKYYTLLILGLFAVGYADAANDNARTEVQFGTTLSSPIAVFNQIETSSDQKQVTADNVTVGVAADPDKYESPKIYLREGKAKIGSFSLSNSTALASDDALSWKVPTITLMPSGKLEGGNLKANRLDFTTAANNLKVIGPTNNGRLFVNSAMRATTADVIRPLSNNQFIYYDGGVSRKSTIVSTSGRASTNSTAIWQRAPTVEDGVDTVVEYVLSTDGTGSVSGGKGGYKLKLKKRYSMNARANFQGWISDWGNLKADKLTLTTFDDKINGKNLTRTCEDGNARSWFSETYDYLVDTRSADDAHCTPQKVDNLNLSSPSLTGMKMVASYVKNKVLHYYDKSLSTQVPDQCVNILRQRGVSFNVNAKRNDTVSEGMSCSNAGDTIYSVKLGYDTGTTCDYKGAECKWSAQIICTFYVCESVWVY